MMARTDPPMVVMIGARTNVPESCGKSSGVLSLHVLHGTKKGI